MNRVEMTRGFDDLGRIVVPIEIRRAMGITSETKMEISADTNKITLKKFEKDPIGASLDNLIDAFVTELDNPAPYIDMVNELRARLDQQAPDTDGDANLY